MHFITIGNVSVNVAWIRRVSLSKSIVTGVPNAYAVRLEFADGTADQILSGQDSTDFQTAWSKAGFGDLKIAP